MDTAEPSRCRNCTRRTRILLHWCGVRFCTSCDGPTPIAPEFRRKPR